MFEFTEADLNANKRGQLSRSQKDWLKNLARGARSSSRSNTWIAIGFAFFGLCLILALYLQNESTRTALLADPMNFIALLAIVPVVIAIMSVGMFFMYRSAKQLENAVLSTASGAVRFDEDSSGQSHITTYYVIVGKKKFKFADDMSRVFKEGEKYKVYYCNAGLYEFVMSYEQITT